MVPAVRRIRMIAVLCAVSFLAGCASLPLKRTPNYLLEDLYRRISYRLDGNYRVATFFYATSRQVAGDPSGGAVFRPDLADMTTLGTLDVRIDPRVKIGTMLPDQLKRRGVLGLQRTDRLDPDAFYRQLSAAVASSPHRSLLVLIFGYKDGFEATAMKAAYFAYLLDVNTPVLVFDWPGDQPVTIAGYKKAQANAIASGPQLATVLARVIREVRPAKIWIEASSMGCQVVCDAFAGMFDEPDLADAEAEIDHVVLAAPDVGLDEFKAKFKGRLSALAKKLTAYVASDDDALLISGFINQDTRLGRPRIRKQDPAQFHEAKELIYLQSLEPNRVTIIDVTPVNHASFKHGYYLEAPEFYDDFYMRLFDAQTNVNRRLYLLKCVDGADYWVMQDEGLAK